MYCIQEEIVQIHDFNAFEHHTHESALEYKGFVELFFSLNINKFLILSNWFWSKLWYNCYYVTPYAKEDFFMYEYLFFDWLQQEYSIAQMNRYILFLPNAKKKCLPNNFVQLKIIKSCPKRKENPLIMQKIVIFYTEIFTGKIVLWCFFRVKRVKKIHNSTFQVKILV